jgi:hypothetical protein
MVLLLKIPVSKTQWNDVLSMALEAHSTRSRCHRVIFASDPAATKT